MPIATSKFKERRWIVLATDGRYVTLGRASDPSEEEVRRAEEALHTQGLAGWLAVMEGSPHGGPEPRLLEVRPLAAPAISFEKAAAAFARAIVAARAQVSY